MKFSLTEIDTYLNKLDKVENDNELRKLFAEFNIEFDLNVPEDPFSKQYRDKQFEIYEKLAGKAYVPTNEITNFDVNLAAIQPFPYYNESCELVGNHLLAIGFMIKSLKLPPKARILEFGPGWGNTTLILAKMGFDVTAVDIEQNFVDLIKKRSIMEKLNVNVLRGDFSVIKNLEEKYDAIIFFECFHHAQDHIDLIASFDKVLKPNGIICFASEPITEDFPIPWGLRMDGESIWAVRKNGWLELGYNIKYFLEALRRFGFEANENVGHDGPWSRTLVAKRITKLFNFNAGIEPLKNEIGKHINNGLKIDYGEKGFAVYGPYFSLTAGDWRVKIHLSADSKRHGEFIFDIVDNFGEICILKPTLVSLEKYKNEYTIEFTTDFNLKNCEIRIQIYGKSEMTLDNISVQLIEDSNL